MIGSPLEASKSKVSSFRCEQQKSNFIISWNTQGSMTTLRKTIGLALSCLAPSKLYSKYVENIKMLGGKPDRAEFGYVANEMQVGINKEVSFSVVGKINIDGTKLKKVIGSVVKKLASSSMVPKKDTNAPSGVKHEEQYSINAKSATDAIITADYLRSKGFNVNVMGDKIKIHDASWVSKKKTIKKGISDFVKRKHDKLKGESSCLLAYMTIVNGSGDCNAVNTLAKSSKLNVSEILKKTL
jgi:hypothetical protein